MTKVIIRTNEYYNHPEYYSFMPESVFSALEEAFLHGFDTAEVPENDFLSMNHKIILQNGIESN